MNTGFQTPPWADGLRISEGGVHGICRPIWKPDCLFIPVLGLFPPVGAHPEGFPLRNQCVRSIADRLSSTWWLDPCPRVIFGAAVWGFHTGHFPTSPGGPREHLEGFHLWKKWAFESMDCYLGWPLKVCSLSDFAHQKDQNVHPCLAWAQKVAPNQLMCWVNVGVSKLVFLVI